MIKNEKTINFWKWFGTITFFIAAFLVSSNSEFSKWGFPLFAFGHLAYAILFTKLKDWAMATQGIGFLVVDLYGVYMWFL